MSRPATNFQAAVACGGTGGHLFPGLAVARSLRQQGCDVTIFVSQKSVDREALKQAAGFSHVALQSVGLTGRNFIRFLWQLTRAYRQSSRYFQQRPPDLVMAMGGFTSAAPILAGRRAGAVTALHESNAIPGRANRLLSRFADAVFVGFEAASGQFADREVKVTGTPVRKEFIGLNAAECRQKLGFDPDRPVLLVTGGSQGASGINAFIQEVLPPMRKRMPELQYILLTGTHDLNAVQRTATQTGAHALVSAFLPEMEVAAGAATLAVSRAGASSLNEMAAAGLPVILVPYPHAAANHQYYNARLFVEAGGARLMLQPDLNPEGFLETVHELIAQPKQLEAMSAGMRSMFVPDAADRIAAQLLEMCRVRKGLPEFDSRPVRPLHPSMRATSHSIP